MAWGPRVAQLATAGAGYCEELQSPDCGLVGHIIPIATTQLCHRTPKEWVWLCSDKTLLKKGGQVWCN